jgi:putative hydrolase of the HAD superfamily
MQPCDPTVIFFDVDDTLLDNVTAQKCAARKFGQHFHDILRIEADAFVGQWHEVIAHHYARYLAGAIGFQDQRRGRIRAFFGSHLSDLEADDLFDIYLNYYEESWTLFPDVIPALSLLADFKLGVITNGNPEQQRKKLQRFGLADHFAVVITPEDVGVSKPHPQIFAYACEAVSAHPADCLYVGDQLETDAHAARSAGLMSVWLDRGVSTKAILDDMCVVHALTDLPCYLPMVTIGK